MMADAIARAFNTLPPKLQVAATLALIEERPHAEMRDRRNDSNNYCALHCRRHGTSRRDTMYGHRWRGGSTRNRVAGIVVPTMFLLIIMCVYAYNRYYFEVSSQFVIPLPSAPLDRAILFPMAVVPNVWGAWNMLYLGLHTRVRLSLGLHGALLPLVLMPAGYALARALDVFDIQWQYALPMVPVGMAIYYLLWKHLVGFLNREVGVA
jgi:hypothetical protein